jgi:preprotein translocase subunit SecA
LTPEQFVGLSADDATNLAVKEVERLYEEKEVHFPVSVGLANFLAEHDGGGEKYDREGLVRWANTRFQCNLNLDEFKGKSRDEIRGILVAHSAAFRQTGSRDALQQDDFNARYRPELCQAERALVLEVLDQSWKDHLYYMDHLRQGIGLVGYAQKDPKVEYKREGMKAFDGMWRRVNDEVTRNIFRMEEASPGFVGSLWQITDMSHASPPPDDNLSATPDGAPSANSPDGEKAVEPIRNRNEHVGRNDPCPCGSGKKFKNCHMRNKGVA